MIFFDLEGDCPFPDNFVQKNHVIVSKKIDFKGDLIDNFRWPRCNTSRIVDGIRILIHGTLDTFRRTIFSKADFCGIVIYEGIFMAFFMLL